jgi:hypothetical protein
MTDLRGWAAGGSGKPHLAFFLIILIAENFDTGKDLLREKYC